MQERRSFFEFNYHDLIEMCVEQQLPLQSAALLFNWHYKKSKTEPLLHQDLSFKAREYFYQTFTFDLPLIDSVQQSEDRTVKFLMKLHDGRKVESVLIPFQQKYTLCLSSQVGCAMNCAFCFTGQQGFTRHLQTSEIVGQLMSAKNWLTQHRPDDDRVLNIVFMGQGEPLHNFEAVKKACEIFTSQHGLSLADHKITVSTSGYLPGLLRWKEEMPTVNIALSLHSVFDDKRTELIPINRKYPLAEILPIINSIPEGKKRFATFEYLLIKDFNDRVEDAEKLGETLMGTKAFLNIIPFNPIPNSKFKRPSDAEVEAFKDRLTQYKIPVTVRTTKGDAIMAACGQLNTGLPTVR